MKNKSVGSKVDKKSNHVQCSQRKCCHSGMKIVRVEILNYFLFFLPPMDWNNRQKKKKERRQYSKIKIIE